MKISNSSIFMSSAHEENSYSYRETMTMEAAKSKDAAGAILTLSKEAEGRSVKDAMAEYQKQQEDEIKKKRQEQETRSLQNMAEQLASKKTDNQFELPQETDMKIKMLRQILAALRGEQIPEEERISADKGNVLDLRSAQYRQMEKVSFSLNSEKAVSLGVFVIGQDAAAAGTPSVGTTQTGTTWQKITASSGFYIESEHTTFASAGIVQTADGRNIEFGVEVSMSRAFMQEINMLEVKDYIKTDPLMINLDTDIGSVSDQKFFFDLDADGKEEEISFAGKGSGFLAYDKNQDGTVNDGTELFGTKSGDGFRDLAAYDEDGNGWIDENDTIFSKLKVWTKDENGKDMLLSLKQADVGAIYLGNADTQFSLKNEDHELNAQIRKTGIYLKESSAAVGTINHVDLAI